MKKILISCSVFAFILSGCADDDGPRFGSFAEVSSPSEMQSAINYGSSEIVLTQALTEDMTLRIPRLYDHNGTLTLRIPVANGNNIKIVESELNFLSFPILSLDIDNANDLEIITPQMEVSFDGAVTGALTASTTTLSILEDARVGTLNVPQGNIRLFGTVDTFGDIPGSSKILRPVATAEELRERLAAPYDHIDNGGVVLTADVEGTFPTITGAQATQDAFRIGDAATYGNSAYDGYVFDGNGFSISGSAWNNVFAIYADDVVVNNLVVTQTAAQKAMAKSDGNPANNNGISVYRSKGAVLNNVTVTDCGRAGIVVNSSEVTANNLTMSGNTWGGVNVTKGVNPEGGDKPVFVLTGGTFTGQTGAVYVTLSSTGTDYSVTVPSGWTDATDSNVKVYSPPAN